jgi:hypothetical protein
MRAINAAYAVLANPGRRAVYDARRFMPRQRAAVARAATASRRPPMRTATAADAVASPPTTALQRRVDRIVAVVGVLLLIAIGFYAVNVIPYAEQQFQTGRVETAPRPIIRLTAPSDEHPTGAVPERLRSDAGLKSFAGTVLLAPSTLEPFASLPILRMDATSAGIARYAVYYGDLTNGATISGLVGSSAFAAAAPRLPDCASDAPYCVGPAPGQTSGPPGFEVFRPPDLVADYSAFVTHRVCCNGVFWSVSWYEPRAFMSYTIDLSRSVAARYGSSTAQDDTDAARAVAALAHQLVRLP